MYICVSVYMCVHMYTHTHTHTHTESQPLGSAPWLNNRCTSAVSPPRAASRSFFSASGVDTACRMCVFRIVCVRVCARVDGCIAHQTCMYVRNDCPVNKLDM